VSSVLSAVRVHSALWSQYINKNVISDCITSLAGCLRSASRTESLSSCQLRQEALKPMLVHVLTGRKHTSVRWAQSSWEGVSDEEAVVS